MLQGSLNQSSVEIAPGLFRARVFDSIGTLKEMRKKSSENNKRVIKSRAKDSADKGALVKQAKTLLNLIQQLTGGETKVAKRVADGNIDLAATEVGDEEVLRHERAKNSSRAPNVERYLSAADELEAQRRAMDEAYPEGSIEHALGMKKTGLESAPEGSIENALGIPAQKENGDSATEQFLKGAAQDARNERLRDKVYNRNQTFMYNGVAMDRKTAARMTTREINELTAKISR
uniref:hypothetical protein n=1 Tax=Pantoea sp. A4 TaxID=1225184 RepID=UPI000474E295